MSVAATDWVWRHSPYSGAEKVIHLALADSANDMHDFEIWARQAWIANKAGVSRETVYRWLAKAEADGMIVCLENNKAAGKPNRYRFLMPDVAVVWDPKEGRSEGETSRLTPPDGGETSRLTGCDLSSHRGETIRLTETEVETEDVDTSLSPASQPTATVIELSDRIKGSTDSESGRPDQGAGLSYPSGTISPEVSQARTILIEEGYDPADVEKALTSTEGGEVVDAKWVTYRGKPYDAETLAESVRLAVAFADACDDAGNKRPNPFTHKECEPMRKLLLTDEKEPRHIRILIRWTFDDDFWCSNVLCTRKFREKWDQLAGARRREINKAKRSSGGDSPVGEDWMARSASR